MKTFRKIKQGGPPVSARKASIASTMTRQQRKDMIEWARKATKGLDESRMFLGIFDDSPLDEGRIEFTLQIGHALLTGKPIILTVPHGVEIPKKLEAIAERIVRYNMNDPESMTNALRPALHGVMTSLDKATQ